MAWRGALRPGARTPRLPRQALHGGGQFGGSQPQVVCAQGRSAQDRQCLGARAGGAEGFDGQAHPGLRQALPLSGTGAEPTEGIGRLPRPEAKPRQRNAGVSAI